MVKSLFWCLNCLNQSTKAAAVPKSSAAMAEAIPSRPRNAHVVGPRRGSALSARGRSTAGATAGRRPGVGDSVLLTYYFMFSFVFWGMHNIRIVPIFPHVAIEPNLKISELVSLTDERTSSVNLASSRVTGESWLTPSTTRSETRFWSRSPGNSGKTSDDFFLMLDGFITS